MTSYESFLSRDAQSFRPSAIRAFAKLINDPNIISFAGGVPNPETFPAAAVAELAERIIRTRPQIALQYGPTRGIPRLCDSIAAICRARGIDATADDVLTTTGSQQALDLIAHALLDPGDVVAVELPTYIGGSASFFARSAELAGVAQDDEGIVPESLRALASRRRIKLLYTIPNFQNPSGRLMTQARRDAVLALAEEFDFLVIEDDPYGELRYVADADTTAMKSRDAHGRVLYLGSFSKVLAPGLRCGWIVAPRTLLATLEIAKQAADLCSGMLDQSVVDEFVASGALAPQIERVRAFYRGKRGVLLDALQTHFGGRATWTPADGGLFTFMTLGDDVDTAARVADAVANGVAYIPGGPFFVDGSGRNTMRLTFAKESDERLREGVARLAKVFGLH
ncbi:MAG: PLP-dependent aminotransferase family protein [Acidobacteria bacterium]|nr:PLP-dependent aminotransferase family protein [Acidobacteriota bacterium]MBV9476059.1 PLP-dependent aminotransferase family protein [Acidobacteriota bacterium]